MNLRLNRPKDFVDVRSHFPKLIEKKGAIAEAYSRALLYLHVHFRVRTESTATDSVQLCARSERSRKTEQLNAPYPEISETVGVERDFTFPRADKDDMDQSMLVIVRKLAKGHYFVPALVRLASLDVYPYWIGNSWQFPVDPGIEVIESGQNRILDVLFCPFHL